METAENLLQHLNETMARLRVVFRTLADPDGVVYEEWTAKDVLAHLTFWHESFARNVSDLAQDKKPTPLKGRLSDLNQQGVDEMRHCTVEQVMQRLEEAHRVIQTHILSPKIEWVPYRKGSRDYTREEHLDIVIKHIEKHLSDIQSAR